MSAMGLEGWAELALLIFLVVFAVVVARLFNPKRRDEYERAGQIPLEGDLDDADLSEGNS